MSSLAWSCAKVRFLCFLQLLLCKISFFTLNYFCLSLKCRSYGSQDLITNKNIAHSVSRALIFIFHKHDSFIISGLKFCQKCLTELHCVCLAIFVNNLYSTTPSLNRNHANEFWVIKPHFHVLKIYISFIEIQLYQPNVIALYNLLCLHNIC